MQVGLQQSHTIQAIHARLARGPGQNYLGDWIYGGIDGAIATFAIVVGAGLPTTVVLLLGFANLVTDGFAMSATNYSGTKAERDDYDRLVEEERRTSARYRRGREEIRQISSGNGFTALDFRMHKGRRGKR